MGGLLMVFKDYRLTRGIFSSPWAGLQNFKNLFNSPVFPMVFRNIVVISALKLLFSFPAPIIIALMLNSIAHNKTKRFLQTALYLPHFISWVVLGNLVFTLFVPSSGAISRFLLDNLGLEFNIMTNPGNFRWTLVLSDIWKEVGWGSIIYLAALSGMDASLYEAAGMDGASKFQQLIYMTLPMLLPTIMIMLLLRVGRIMDAGFEQIFVLQNPMVYDVSEILDTYVYKVSFTQGQHAIGAAEGFVKSCIGLVFVVVTNKIAERFGQEVL